MVSAHDFLEALRRFHLLEPAQLDVVTRQVQGKTLDAPRIARELVKKGWLTSHQSDQLLQGHGSELLLGSYVLLDKLGEGGMGAVFKARNWKLGQIVALKLIRKERLTSADAVRRFQREVRAAAQLDHSHIVRAFDADEVGGTHLLVMEFVAGTDLARVVKEQGPPPIEQACECMRQAALGLQHAFERGLVHRDIKPHNLLLSGSTVKILDFGLARRDDADNDDSSTALTREGAVMGTLDYIAPEQALDSRSVDIRADLYSLGCTFYFLLTGQVPFPGGEALSKLMKHRMDEPTPVEQLRPEVPPPLAAVVRKLMAKVPAQRFQTPAELAVVLQTVMRGQPVSVTVAPPRSQPTVEHNPFAGLDYGETTVSASTPPPERLLAPPRRSRLPLILTAAVGGLLILGGAALGIRLLFFSGKPTQAAVNTTPQPTATATKPTSQVSGVTLFNGKDLTGWKIGANTAWSVGQARLNPANPAMLLVYNDAGPGDLINRGKGENIFTDQEFGDAVFDLEFMVPQGSNSGVYLMSEYELQLFDSFGKPGLGTSDLGALYGVAGPRVNAAKAPGEWQRLVIDFQAPVFENGRKTTNARMRKVTLNNQVIHEGVEVPGPLPQGLTGKERPQGPLMFQGTHGPVAFRNIKVQTPSKP